MQLGESVLRLLGGALMGAAFGWLLNLAPPPLARLMLTAFGVLVVILIALLLFGLGRKATLFVAGLLVILLVAGAINRAVAQSVWLWIRFGADLVAAGVRAATSASLVQGLAIWAVIGVLLNLVAGSVHFRQLRQVW